MDFPNLNSLNRTFLSRQPQTAFEIETKNSGFDETKQLYGDTYETMVSGTGYIRDSEQKEILNLGLDLQMKLKTAFISDEYPVTFNSIIKIAGVRYKAVKPPQIKNGYYKIYLEEI